MRKPKRKHYAIVAGISRYPLMKDIDIPGAEKDAERFYQWVISESGGNVPPDNVRKIVSSQFEGSEPTDSRIVEAFIDLYDRAEAAGGTLGDRLYIYLAGHGIARSYEEACVLAANARKGLFGFHIAGYTYADSFRQLGYFDEIILITDCCRAPAPATPPRAPPFTVMKSANAADVRWVHAYATKFSEVAYENKFAQGIFTTALLEGLKSCEGRVTGEVLKNYLENDVEVQKRVKHQKPEILCGPQPIVIVENEPSAETKVKVIVRVGAKVPNGRLVVDNGSEQLAVRFTKESESSWSCALPRGLYEVRRGNKSKPFAIRGAEEVVRVDLR